MSSTCAHSMMNFGPLVAEIGLPVWGTPANFNGFRVLAALVHGSQVVSVRQTAALNRGRHLCSAGRPWRWALAYISSCKTKSVCLVQFLSLVHTKGFITHLSLPYHIPLGWLIMPKLVLARFNLYTKFEVGAFTLSTVRIGPKLLQNIIRFGPYTWGWFIAYWILQWSTHVPNLKYLVSPIPKISLAWLLPMSAFCRLHSQVTSC